MQVRLKVLRGKSEGKEIRVNGPTFLIGRGDECNLRPRSDVVSRKHCELTVDGETVTVRDLGSRNGTFVNDQSAEKPLEIKAGDLLKVGKLEFEVLIERTIKADAPLKVPANEVKNPEDSAEFDDDISGWLDEAQEVERARRLTDPETRQFKIDDTDRIQPEEASRETERIDEHDTSEEKKKKKIRPEKKAPGKLPKPQGPSSKDSREAAADMLKKFFNAR